MSLVIFWASQMVLVVKNLPANTGDVRHVDSTPRLGRSLRAGHGNPLQYSCLENPMDRGEPGGLQSIGLQSVRHDWSDLEHKQFAFYYRVHRQELRRAEEKWLFPLPQHQGNSLGRRLFSERMNAEFRKRHIFCFINIRRGTNLVWKFQKKSSYQCAVHQLKNQSIKTLIMDFKVKRFFKMAEWPITLNKKWIINRWQRK